MASSSGNSAGSATLQTSVSGEDLQVLMDQRKQKRMQSNRESARRSRMRKQQRVDELMAQVTQLRKDNARIHSDINITSQHYVSIEAENSILRSQMAELTQRLRSLEAIADCSNGGFGEAEEVAFQIQANVAVDRFVNPMNFLCVNQQIQANVAVDRFVNPMNFLCVNQPIMAAAAAADIFQC